MHVIVPIVWLMDHSRSTNEESFEVLVRRYEHPPRMISYCYKRATEAHSQRLSPCDYPHSSSINGKFVYIVETDC